MGNFCFVYRSLFTLFLSSFCSPTEDSAQLRLSYNVLKHIRRTVDIEKAPNDERKYLGLILKNNMELIVVSDPDSTESAASMHIETGSMDDPIELQGMAHFLEHVIHMGTKKYSLDKDEFLDFVTRHGGMRNAMTTYHYTNYHFTIQQPYFSEAIDRFAQFFTDPLLRQESIEREIMAVDSEYLRLLPNDDYKLYEIILDLADPQHRFFKFLCGNKKSLLESARALNISLSGQMRKFFDKFYTASRMKLAVLGRESIYKLAELIVPLFAEVRDGLSKRETRLLRNANQTGYEIKYKPVEENKRSLELYFPMPDLLPHFNALPIQYIIKFFTNNGPGSFKFWLKHKNLASNVAVSYDSWPIDFGLFSISFDLTEYGLENTDEILKALFAYVNFIKSKPIKDWIQREINLKRRHKFATLDKRHPMAFVTHLSLATSLFGMQKSISGQFEEKVGFDEKPFKEALGHLNTNNFNYFVMSKNFLGQTNRIGQWFQGQYSINKISRDTLRELENNAMDTSAVQFPKPNQFLPSNLINPKYNSNLIDSEISYPKPIYEDEKKRLWFSEAGYDRPTAHANFVIKIPIVAEIQLNLFLKIVAQNVKERLDSAIEMGYAVSLSIIPSGIIVEISGFSEKIVIFAERTFDILANCDIDPNTFSIARSLLVQEVNKSLIDSPIKTTIKNVNRILTTPYTRLIEKLPEIQEIKIEDMRVFKSKAFSSFYLESFIFGDIDKENALKTFKRLADIIEGHGAKRPVKKSDIRIARTVQLPYNSHFLFEEISLVHDQSSVIVNFQSEFDKIKDVVVSDLLDRIFIERCYTQFRTTEKLGYVVGCYATNSLSVGHFIFIIEGNHSAKFINSRIDAFVTGMKDQLGKITAEEFALFKETLTKDHMKKSLNFYEMMIRYWREMKSGEYFFARRRKYAEELEKVTMEDLFEYVERVLGDESVHRKKLVVYTHGLSHAPSANQSWLKDSGIALDNKDSSKWPTKIIDVEDFKRSMSLYPTIKPKLKLKFPL